MQDLAEFAGVMFVILGMPLTIFFVLAPLAKAVGRRLEGGGGSPDGELEALRAEVAELRDQVARLPELEERLDFAERLLARQDDVTRLGRGGE